MKRLILALAIGLAFQAQADVTVVVTRSSSSVDRMQIVLTGTGEPVTLSLVGDQYWDQWGVPDLAGALDPMLGGNNDGMNSPTLVLRASVAGWAEIDGDPVNLVSITATNGNTTIPLVQTGLTWAGTLITGETYPVYLSWDAPTNNEDGSPYTDPDGYRIYWGPTTGSNVNVNQIDDHTLSEYTIMANAGTQYFTMTAFNQVNNESDFSNEVVIVTGPSPEAPLLAYDNRPFKTVSGDVFSDQKQENVKAMRLIGQVPIGVDCIPTEALLAQSVVYYAVDRALVEFVNPRTAPDIVYGRCE